jgi:hypothetical protein
MKVIYCVSMYVPIMFLLTPGFAGEATGNLKRIEKTNLQEEIMISASMSDTSVAATAVELKIRIQNKSNEGIEYWSKGKYWDYSLTLRDSRGQLVPFTQFGKVAQGRARREGSGLFGTLGAGNEMNETLNLARVFDLSNTGQYTLSVTWKAGKKDKTIDLTVGQIAFRIVEEGKKSP